MWSGVRGDSGCVRPRHCRQLSGVWSRFRLLWPRAAPQVARARSRTAHTRSRSVRQTRTSSRGDASRPTEGHATRSPHLDERNSPHRWALGGRFGAVSVRSGCLFCFRLIWIWILLCCGIEVCVGFAFSVFLLYGRVFFFRILLVLNLPSVAFNVFLWGVWWTVFPMIFGGNYVFFLVASVLCSRIIFSIVVKLVEFRSSYFNFS